MVRHPRSAGEVTEGKEDVLRACYESDEDSGTTCYAYADFKVNEAGELVDFTIDARPLRDG